MTSTIESIMNGSYENHVIPFFWQKGESKEITVEYIEKMKEADIHEFCVESRPFPGFCEDPWWDQLELIIQEAKKRDMRVWIFDDSHFPTGFANGKVADFPHLKKRVLTHHIVRAIGPQKNLSLYTDKPFPVDISQKFFSAVAYSEDKIIQLEPNINNGKLYFDLPEGDWQIFIMNISTQTDIASDHINMVDKESCQILINEVYEKHYARFKDEFGKTIVGFFSDEPAFRNEKGNKSDSKIGKDMPLPWSDEVEKLLKDILGKSYTQLLPHLWQNIDNETSKIRYTYMDVVTTLYKENFNDALGNWCRSHNVQYIGHIIEDRDSHARLGVGPGHFFRSMSGQDMAGSDVVLNQILPGLDTGVHSWTRGKWDGEFFHYALGKLTSSLANIDPKKQGRSVTEVFGAYGWHEGIKLMKWVVDHFLVRGVNHFIPHAFSPAPFPDLDSPPHFYAHGNNPQFRFFGKLMTYTNKMGTLLSGGKAKPKVAVLYHAEAEWAGDYMSCQKPARILTQHQVDFDIVPTDIFKNNEYPVDFSNKLCVNKIEYTTLIIPYSQYISHDLYNFIKKNQQTKIIFIDEYPEGFFDSDIGLQYDDISKNSQVIDFKNLGEYIEGNQLSELEITTKEPYLRYYLYEKNNISYHMLFNEDPKLTINTKIKINGLENMAKVDLLNNLVEPIVDNVLILEPYESCIIVDQKEVQEVIKDIHEFENERILPEVCTISFSTAEQYPNFYNSMKIDKLVNISKNIAPNFSGTIRYTFEVELSKTINNAVMLLEEVYEIAEVKINDQSIGVRLCQPYRFDMNQLPKGTNKIDIEVTNTLDKEQYDNLSASQLIQPSGLISPVRIFY